MRNGEDTAGVGAEITLEPLERLKIEMVCRLVEHEEIRFHHEEAREMGAHDPSAAQFAHGPQVIALAEGQTVENAFRLGLEVKAIEPFETQPGVVVFGFVGAILPLEEEERAPKLHHFRGDRGGEFEHGFVACGGVFLGRKPKVTRLSSVMDPSSGISLPRMSEKRVVFPAPFGPTNPTRSSRLSWRLTSWKRTRPP